MRPFYLQWDLENRQSLANCSFLRFFPNGSLWAFLFLVADLLSSLLGSVLILGLLVFLKRKKSKVSINKNGREFRHNSADTDHCEVVGFIVGIHVAIVEIDVPRDA